MTISTMDQKPYTLHYLKHGAIYSVRFAHEADAIRRAGCLAGTDGVQHVEVVDERTYLHDGKELYEWCGVGKIGGDTVWVDVWIGDKG